MATSIIPNDGKIGLMEATILGLGTAAVKLYRNIYTPVLGSVYTDFVEANFPGYSDILLNELHAVDRGIDPRTMRDVFTFDQCTYRRTAGPGPSQVIYGYYVQWHPPSNPAGKRILWARRLATPVSLVSSGDQVQFILSLGGTQAT